MNYNQNAYLLRLVKSTEKNTSKLKKEGGVQSKPKSKTRMYTINELSEKKALNQFSISKGRFGRSMLHHNKNPNELPRERRGSKENQGVDP